jgi:adenylosuccinate lyase|tara:strand:+ start:6027 stop:7394 length:1368 start_codon:yes stop_codon:yes gene_type:complete
MTFLLNALSPVDGRYSDKADRLRPIFSEYGLIKKRVTIEVQWLIALSKNQEIKEIPIFSDKTLKKLNDLINSFDEQDAQAVKDIEKTTNHDVKAVEYWIKNALISQDEIQAVSEFIHFGCTSEDINNLSYALMLKEGINNVVVPEIQKVQQKLTENAIKFSAIPLLARTHGQTASPTTLGKEFANVAQRISRQLNGLSKQQFLGKMNGAVGNFNAHTSAYPDVDWNTFSKTFVTSLGLEYNEFTTQIEPHDFIAEIFHNLLRINTILIDFNRDIWSYISLGYFSQKTIKNEVGSSTMPHKVNPIDFENSEGNLGLSNALLSHLAEKLPISRWQRDLTDSTVLRNMGLTLAYGLIAYQSCLKGLNKLVVNESKINQDLDSAWEVLAEPIQTVMRKNGIENPYEKLKDLTRGSEIITQEVLRNFIEGLDIPAEDKTRLLTMSPQNYIGIAAILAKKS